MGFGNEAERVFDADVCVRELSDYIKTFDSVPEFKNVAFPVIALAGGKEQQSVRESVKKMAEINGNCKYEVWEKAAHNIPPMFSREFNSLIIKTARTVT